MSHPATPASAPSGSKGALGPSSWMSATSTHLAARLADMAKDMDGRLVLWIGQVENPGQVENARLVREAAAAGLEGQLGIEEALGGACYAIVLELFRDVITRKVETPSKDYLAEMLFIPDRYREIQRTFAHKVQAYFLAVRIAVRDGNLVLKYDQLLSTARHAAPAIRSFWQRELDRCAASTTKNTKAALALSEQLYVSPELAKAGIGSTLVRANSAVNAEIVLKTALAEDGCVMVGLQGRAGGHAVGFVIKTRFMRDDTCLLVDPNTGIFQFNNATLFRAFVKEYWDTMLQADYPRGTISRYK